jgi:hypothetical protein
VERVWAGYPTRLSTLLLATSAVCGVYGGDHSARPTVIEPSSMHACYDGILSISVRGGVGS